LKGGRKLAKTEIKQEAPISDLAKTLKEAGLLLKKIEGKNDLIDMAKLIFEALKKLVNESSKAGRKKISFQGGAIFIRGGGKLSGKERELLQNLNATIQKAIEALNG